MRTPPRRAQRGLSLPEVCVALALAALGCALAAPPMAAFQASARRQAAGAEIRQAINRLRFEALHRGVAVGAVLSDRDGEPWFQIFVDGNANGVTAADRSAGIDKPLGPPERLSPEVRLRLARPPGMRDGDAITFRGDTLTFSPLGSFSNGTLYLGDGREFLRARLNGTSGALRIERWLPAKERWQEIQP